MATVKSTQIVIDSRSTKVNVSEIHLLACLWVLNELGQLERQNALRTLSKEVYHKEEDTNIRNLLKALETIGAISLTTEPLRIQITERAKDILEQSKQ